MAGVSNLSMVVEVTNIEDSVHGRQSPYVYFWGTTYDRILMMKKYIESIRNSIENRPPPTDVKELSGVFCVLIFHEWRRAKVLQPVLSHTGTLEVFLIDYGHSHTARLVFLRTLDIPGTASEYVREMPDLATKYLLADVLAPPGCDSPYYWSEPAMMYLKLNVNDRPWKATSMGMCCGHQCLRLFTYANDHLLATLMIEQGLGVPSHTYKEALSMCNILQEQSSSTFLAGHKIDNKESGECGKQSLLVDSRDDYSLSTGNEDTLGPLEYQTVQQVEKLPTSLAMLDTDIFPLVQISGLPKLNATDVRNISPKLEKVATAFVTEIPRAWLASEEKLYVTLAQEAGSFFGQLEKNPLKDLDNMKSELMVAYSSDQNHPLLYADANSHLGHYGVVYWDEEDNFYRIRVIEEFINDAKVKFIDYGNCRQIPRCKILAPLESLSCFRISPFGIDCKMDDVPLSLADWSKFILKKKIRVKIGKCVNEVYSVTLTDELCNKEIAEVISSKTTPTCTSIPACSIRDCTVAVENVVEQTTDSNNDRLKRNSENSNFGKNRYVHPNADDDNKKTSGVENVTQSGNVKLSRKGKELIRSPRGSPLSTGNGEMKGPLRSLKPEKVEERTPNPLIQPGVQKSISVKQQPQQALPEVDSRVEDLCQLEVMDIDQLPVVKKESAESDSDHSKRKKNSSKCGKSRYVQPNGEDSNKKTSGAEHITKSGQGKASSKDCNPGPHFYQAQEVIRNPQGSPLSTGNGEMKGPLRSLKPEKVEERTPNPLIQPGVQKSISVKQQPQQALPEVDSRVEDLCQLEVMDIDQLPVVKKESAESDSDHSKRKKNSSKCGKSRYVQPNGEDSNKKTSGAEHITKSGQGKASSKDCNPGPPFYQAQEVIRNPQGSPLSTGNGEMKGPLRSQKPEKVEERTPNPLIQPGVEISPPAENSELSKLPPTSAVPKPQKIRKDLLAVESVLAKNGSDKNRLKRNIGNENCGKSHYVLSNTEHSNSRTGGAEDECETVNMDAGPSTISEALLKQSSPSTVEEDVNKIISSTGDSTDVFVPCVEFSSICPSTLDAHGTLAESKAEGTIEEFPLLPVIYFAPGQKMSSYAFSSHIESATEIWIQLDPTAVDSLMAKIAEMDVSQLETPDLQLHTSCLALFPDDGRWYRALINSIDVNEAKVTFVDYGKSSLVNVGDLRVLPSFLTQTSGLALKCALDGTQQNLISSPTSDQCESIIAQEVLTVVFAGRSSGHLYVRLLDPSGLDLNEKLGFPESFSIESVASNLLEFNPLDDVEMSSPVARTADPDPLFNIDGDATLPLEVEDVRGVTAEPIVVIPTVLGHSENEKAEMVVNQTEQDVAKENEFYQCFSDSVNSFVQESIMEPRGGLEAKDVSEQLAIRLMSYQAQEVIRNPRGPPSTGNGEMKGPLQSQRPEKVEERSPTPLFQPDVEISPTDMLSELPKPQPISAVQQPRQAMPVADCRVEDLSDPGAGTASKVENLKVTKSAQRNKKRDNKRKVVVGVVPRDGSHMEEVLCEHLFDMNIQGTEIDRVSGHNSGGPSSGWSV